MPYLGNPPAVAYSSTVKDYFNGDASTTSFTMSLPSTTNNVRVVVENVIQDPGVAYTCSGTSLNFTSAPPFGTANIYVIHLGPAVQTVTPPAEIGNATNFTDGITVDKNGGTVITADRASSDGTIIDLQKSGTTRGVIGTESTWGSGPQFLGSNSRGFIIANPNTSVNEIIPNVDTVGKLGNSSNRWADLYLSGSVYLGGTGSANALDDVEEGTFTLTMYGGTTTKSPPITIPGTYTKVGRLVSVFAETSSQNSTGYSGYPYFGGLPFTPSTTGLGNVMSFNAFTFVDDGGLVAQWYTNGICYLYENRSANTWATLNINTSSDWGIKLSGTYYTT